jgi:glutamyl-tRNA(Gln) amidotransferase subunit D
MTEKAKHDITHEEAKHSKNSDLHTDINPGDKVKITTKDEEFTGTLMPRPEILEKGITVLKLDNGYNIGIEEKKIVKTELVKGYQQKVAEKMKLTHKSGLPNVSILSFGGTISSKVDYKTGGTTADYTAEDFVAMCPELADIANLKAKKIMSVMSEDFNWEIWKRIAEEAAEELNNGADGVVITQGTDTLHYTTAAVSFMLEKIGKPVIFTAAQRSIDRGSTDAFMNLVCAVSAAARLDASGVYTCMHGTMSDDYCILIKGTKVRKMHTSRRDAFRPINDLPTAKVFRDGKIELLDKDLPKKDPKITSVPDTNAEEKVAIIYVYPGMDTGIIDYYSEKGYKGIVISATALGHVPTTDNHSILPGIKRAIDKGITVVISSQTLYGRVHPYVYTNLRKLSVELDCIFAEDMMPEVAYAKLGYVLGKEKSHKKIKELFLKNIAGEITERTSPESFLY